MTTTLAESIQKNLGYPELLKIDPNTQSVKEKYSNDSSNQFGQAAIPAVLLGLYKYGNTDEGSEQILRGNMSTNWLDLFFTGKREEVINKVASYGGKPDAEAAQHMEEIAAEGVRIIRENTPDKASFTDIKSYVANQRNSILVFLPAELQISAIINDNTLDDRTNKMEGPISNAVHFIEKIFSGSTTEKNEGSEEGDSEKS